MVDDGKMGILHSINYVIGGVIGSGILISPTSVLSQTGSVGLSLVVWLVCGFISFLGGLAYLELGTGIPSNGGDFAYANYVGWRSVAFSFMLPGVLLTYPASTAVQTVTFGKYLVSFAEQVFTLPDGLRYPIEIGLGFALLFVIITMNWYRVDKFAAVFQTVCTVLKFVVLAAIVACGIIYYFCVDNTKMNDPFANSDYSMGNMIMASYGGMWSYAGWEILNYGVPEIRNPRTTLPVALLGGLAIVTSVYLAVNTAFFAVLTPAQMLNSTALAADFADAAFPYGSFMVPLVTALFLMSTINSNVFLSVNLTYDAARNNQLPRFLAALNNQNDSKRAALLLHLCCSMMLCFVDVDTVISYVIFVMWAQKLLTMAALLKIRWLNIDVDRGVIRIPVVISIVLTVICALLVFIPFYTDFTVTIIGVVFVSSGFIFYGLFVWPSRQPQWISKTNNVLADFACSFLKCEVSQVGDKDSQNDVSGSRSESGTDDERTALRQEVRCA